MKKIVNTVFTLATMACAVVAFVMLTHTGMVHEETNVNNILSGMPSGSESYTLSEMSFGCERNGNIILDTSYMVFLPHFLLFVLMAPLLVQLISGFVKPKPGGRKLMTPFVIVLEICIFVAAGVLFLCVIDFVSPYAQGYDKVSSEMYEVYKEQYLAKCTLGSGAITAAICSFVGAALTLVGQIICKVIKDKQ